MKIAVSMGDVNGIGIEIALRAHDEVSQLCSPIYCINSHLLKRSSKLLNLPIPHDFILESVGEDFDIQPSCVDAQSGEFSYASFLKASELTKQHTTDALVTLPINKESWSKAGITYRGHTEAYEEIFPTSKPIMMLGCVKLYVSLYTHHIPLREVADRVNAKELESFISTVYKETKEPIIGVLGLNPHAGDGGILGDEEKEISLAIKRTNEKLGKEIFHGPLVPDTAFLDKRFRHFICMYHDQGLIVLKRLHFDESINATLNIPIIRTSVDHGTAFDIAYQDNNPSTKSYINAFKTAIELVKNRKSKN